MPGPKRRPRALTLTLPDHLRPFLILEGEEYVLRNFSEDGIGVWMPSPAPFGLTKGSRVSGDIEMGNQIHPVQLEVVHQEKGMVGLRILHKSVELGTIFRRMLEPTAYAGEIEAHPKSLSVDKTVGLPRLWYRTRGTELLVWFDAKSRMILGMQLRWLGQWVFRERLHPAQTGYLAEFEQPDHGEHARSKEILFQHGQADPELMQRAGQFLVSVPKPLPGYLFWQFLENGKPLELPASLLISAKAKKAS